MLKRRVSSLMLVLIINRSEVDVPVRNHVIGNDRA
jgi:hypothetical protein